ncbi:uncharacterized protein LOC131834797 [Mustela lutreola]|uniref:uncharacterized protein LOC131834797 n=1 Tax=Mustela lutreola TaxID=9666 RepID=UPI002797534C|nr:uncharacterized protein LOC131834797 [Mustela lutreola]
METSSSTSRGQHQPRRELGPSPPGCRWRHLWGTARPLSGSRSAPREPGPDAPHRTGGFYWRFSAGRRPRQEPGRRASLALQYLPWLRGAQQSWALGIKTRGRAFAVLKEVPACSQGLQPAPGLRDGGSGGPGAGRAGRRAGAELGAGPRCLCGSRRPRGPVAGEDPVLRAQLCDLGLPWFTRRLQNGNLRVTVLFPEAFENHTG